MRFKYGKKIPEDIEDEKKFTKMEKERPNALEMAKKKNEEREKKETE